MFTLSEIAQKQCILEPILDMFLTNRQLEYIKTNWKAFWNDPYAYKDTVVVSMVKLGLENM